MKNFFGLLFLLLLMMSSFAFATEEAVVPLSPDQSYIFNIFYEDAESAISKALTEKSTDGKIVSAIISGKKTTPLYSSNKPISVEVRGLRPDSTTNRWSANLVILSDTSEVLSAMPLSGRYLLMVEVPVLKQSMQNGELIKDTDIERKTFPQERVLRDTITDSTSLIGKSPKRNISPARPIRTNEISAPAVVKKNSAVMMRYKTSNMEITAAGQALADGAKGEVIEVKNISSKKVTSAVVVDANTVDVMVQGVPNNAK